MYCFWSNTKTRRNGCSISGGVIGIFQWLNPSGRTVALGSTQPVTEISTSNPSWGRDGRCVGLTTLPPSCGDCLEILEHQPPGTSRPLQACSGKDLSLHFCSVQNKIGHARRVACSHFGSCFLHKETWRSTQKNNTRSSHTSCKVHWGRRSDFRKLVLHFKTSSTSV
jgi:hypothetical protein